MGFRGLHHLQQLRGLFQHPVGYTMTSNGRLQISNYWAVLLNPWILPDYMHVNQRCCRDGSIRHDRIGNLCT